VHAAPDVSTVARIWVRRSVDGVVFDKVLDVHPEQVRATRLAEENHVGVLMAFVVEELESA
jgi:hypothetical protein